MLTNIESVDNLRKVSVEKGRDYVTKRVKPDLVEEAQCHSWRIDKIYKHTVQVRKDKAYETQVQDRIWSLLYRMDFLYMNGNEQAHLVPDAKTPLLQTFIIDIVGIDHEVGIAILCKASSVKRNADVRFRQELDEYINARSLFSSEINHVAKEPDRSYKRKPALAIFACNILINEEDKKFAKDKNITILDENDLSYYEELVSHLGAAAKYQFLADLLPGVEIPALDLTIPAIRTKMGKFVCYSFAISPEHLLKISYVAHRARGKRADLQAYQRMLEKGRLDEIKKYINKPGIFPTNIVINLDKKPNFDIGKQITEHKYGTFGWLKLRSAYKSAWVIDGQHRLYAYSGHDRAASSLLSVLAFELLPFDVQAELFIDINSRQKRVKQSLLQELYGDLHKDSPDAEFRIRALISQTIKALDIRRDSAFFQRVQTEEEKRSKKRCISWNSLFQSLSESTFTNAEKGVLWIDDDDTATKERIFYIINGWFNAIKRDVLAWWDAGSGEGGGLAMNDSVVACFNVLKSVLQHLISKGENLRSLSSEELYEYIAPYALAVSKYLSSLSKDERQAFRLHRGSQGQTQRTKMLQIAINKDFPDFMPSGLKEHIAEKMNNVKPLLAIIKEILSNIVLEELYNECGSQENQWWMAGIPEKTRQEVSRRYEEDRGKQGSKEHYFEFLDYQAIIRHNWHLFQDTLRYDKACSNIENCIAWIGEINDVYNLIMQNKPITFQQITELEIYGEWLRGHVRQMNGMM